MGENLELLPIWYLAFIISITFHEAAHALVGSRLGDDEAAKSGQDTLNPLPHVKREMVGTIIIPIISYYISGWMIGWASAPYNIDWAKKNPRKLALMSIAGPLANLMIVIGVLILTNIGYYLDIFYAPESIDFSYVTDSNVSPFISNLGTFISILFSLNVILFTFNLLPLPVLDGSKIPLFFLKKTSSNSYIDFVTNPRLMVPAIIIAWYVFDYLYDPVWSVFVNLLYLGVTYV